MFPICLSPYVYDHEFILLWDVKRKQAGRGSREWPLSAWVACQTFLSSPGWSQVNACIASKFASVDAHVSLIQFFCHSRVWMTQQHLKLYSKHQVTLWWIAKLMGGKQANSLYVKQEKWKTRLKTQLNTQREATSESESIGNYDFETRDGHRIQMLQML